MVNNLFYNTLTDSLIMANEEPNDAYLWTDYRMLSEYIKDCKPVPFIYTLMNINGTLIILEGYHYINRVGYILSYKKYCNFPKEGIIYKEGEKTDDMGL